MQDQLSDRAARQPIKIGRRRYGIRQQIVVAALFHFYRPELFQMRSCKLGIEQPETADLQSGDQMDQGDLRGIALESEHALAKKSSAETHTIQATSQLPVTVNFDRMAVSQ